MSSRPELRNSVSIKPGSPALLLAPMEGVTDAPMRELQARTGAFTFCVSEFLRVSQEVPPARVILRHTPEAAKGWKCSLETPTTLQLLGGDAGRMAETARLGASLGAPGIDINFGCPAPTVNRNDGGATLLKFPHRIEEIVRAVRAAVPQEIPVSAKLRLGWENIDDVFVNAEAAVRGGASWLTVHARTRMQGYQPPVFWKQIGFLRERLAGAVPVIANGDIWTLQDFERCRELSGAEHFMLGRGALATPGLATGVAIKLGLTSEEQLRSRGALAAPKSWGEILREYHRVLNQFQFPEEIQVRRLKQWLKLSSHGREIPWFDRVKREMSVEPILAVADTVEIPSA